MTEEQLAREARESQENRDDDDDEDPLADFISLDDDDESGEEGDGDWWEGMKRRGSRERERELCLCEHLDRRPAPRGSDLTGSLF